MIDNWIQEFKNKKWSFPIEKNFTELIKIIWTYNNDFRYHYSYEWDWKYYILTYPQDSTEWVKCIVKNYSYSWAVDKTVIDRNCESTITKR